MIVFDLATLSSRRVRTERNADCDHGAGSARVSRPTEIRPLELEFDTLADARASGLELVDVREDWEREADDPDERIACHVPLSRFVQGDVTWPGRGRYLVVCAHGVRSLALAERLRELGYDEVYSLRGGLAGITA